MLVAVPGRRDRAAVDVIYEFHGYIDGGNLQIHHLTGYDLNLTELAENWLEGIG